MRWYQGHAFLHTFEGKWENHSECLLVYRDSSEKMNVKDQARAKWRKTHLSTLYHPCPEIKYISLEIFSIIFKTWDIIELLYVDFENILINSVPCQIAKMLPKSNYLYKWIKIFL